MTDKHTATPPTDPDDENSTDDHREIPETKEIDLMVDAGNKWQNVADDEDDEDDDDDLFDAVAIGSLEYTETFDHTTVHHGGRPTELQYRPGTLEISMSIKADEAGREFLEALFDAASHDP